jgi:hypothetical protein
VSREDVDGFAGAGGEREEGSGRRLRGVRRVESFDGREGEDVESATIATDVEEVVEGIGGKGGDGAQASGNGGSSRGEFASGSSVRNRKKGACGSDQVSVALSESLATLRG